MSTPSTSTFSKTTILVVEDSATQLAQLEHLLGNEGFCVVTARNGAEALQHLGREPFALVISDVVMPVLDGYALCREMKKNPALDQIPVILLTTLSEPGDIFRGLECGADFYTLKPFDPDSLLSRIKAVLEDRYVNGTGASHLGLAVTYAGHKYFIQANRIQILDLLLATFENIVQQKKSLEEANQKLRDALDANQTLHGLLPICAHCKKIRDDQGYWQRVEAYISSRSAATFSHGVCPDCIREHYQDWAGSSFQ